MEPCDEHLADLIPSVPVDGGDLRSQPKIGYLRHPAASEFFVSDVVPVGRTRPTHFGALAYNWAYIFESVIVRPFESCLAGDLRVQRFVPESRDSLVSSESDSAALAPLLAPRTMSWSVNPEVEHKA